MYFLTSSKLYGFPIVTAALYIWNGITSENDLDLD